MKFPDLADALEVRIAVIADHAFRDRDPEAHLEALKNASQVIATWHEAHRTEIDGNLTTSSLEPVTKRHSSILTQERGDHAESET